MNMRQQQFSAMQAVESNLAQQQGQLQQEMMQMEHQMEQLGQTAQREAALLQQTQQGIQQGRIPSVGQLWQNSPMQSQTWNSQFLSQPQLQPAFPQTMQAQLPQQAQAMQAQLPQQAQM